MTLLEIDGVSKVYPPDTRALDGIDLTASEGEIVCLLGPSGCGKSTLLRVVAGLEQADRGSVRFDGRDMIDVPVHERGFGLMFQEFALFPHRSVADNIAFGPRMAGWSREDIDRRVAELLDVVALSGYGDRSVFELSGGQRQRVAMARSLAPNPRLLMLDEPLGDLDRALRETLLAELRIILKQLGLTALYVTHDQQEAFAIADRIAVMKDGRVAQADTPEDLYARPGSPYVARFLGLTNLLPATVGDDDRRHARTPIGSFALGEPAVPGTHTLLIRPDAASLSPAGTDGSPIIRGTVAARSFRGSRYRLGLDVDAAGGTHQRLEFELPAPPPGTSGARVPPDLGQPVALHVHPEGLTLIIERSPQAHGER